MSTAVQTELAIAPAGLAPPLGRRAAREAGVGRRGDLRAILGDGAAFSLMVALGENYLAAFALALGIGEIGVGLLATAPMLAGGLLQLASPWGVNRLRSHRAWVVGCAVCQAVSLLVLPLAALVPTALAGMVVFLAASVYWGAGLAAGPAWNTWVENLVPRPLRARFFAVRVRIGQFAMLAGFVIAGLVLGGGASSGRAVAAFALLFVAAAACRLVSARCLAAQSEPVVAWAPCRRVPLTQWPARLRSGSGGSLLVYLFTVQIAVQIAGPYFTPFMLSQLKMSYLEYAKLIGVAFVGKAVALPWLARFAQRYGARRLLWLGGLGIVPMSGLWLVSPSFAYLAMVQVISGMAWAAYELAMLLMFFEAIPKDERTSVLTVYNLGNAASMVGGALVGGLLLGAFGQGTSAFLAVFAISSLARAATVILLARVPDAAPRKPAAGPLRLHSAAVSIERPALAGQDAPGAAEPAGFTAA